ncbi:MAG: hypothetical protein J7L73_04220 [Anaerolineales bacterium]|nr:hypothetical protein [Anaerolineales bacterium]HEY61318.1 hypothetical protein [Anaerolineae bacterium]
MEISRTTIVICITLFIVVGFNALLYISLVKRKNTVSQIDLLRKAAKRSQNPWIEEEQKLEELSRLVKEFKKEGHNKQE